MVYISVIVPARNEEKMIENCLKAIRAQKSKNYELIVVDGHSTDNTVRIAKKYANLILFNSRRGPGAARNLGAQKAKGEILAFTDADTIVCRNWLATIDKDFGQDESLIGLGGPSACLNGNRMDRLITRIYLRVVASISGVIPLFAGNNCAYRRDAFLGAHGFKEDFVMLEDLELSMRMKKIGNVMFDEKLFVRTSVRRVRQKGYIVPLLKYLIPFLGLLLFGLNLTKVVGKDYFRELEK